MARKAQVWPPAPEAPCFTPAAAPAACPQLTLRPLIDWRNLRTAAQKHSRAQPQDQNLAITRTQQPDSTHAAIHRPRHHVPDELEPEAGLAGDQLSLSKSESPGRAGRAGGATEASSGLWW